MTPDILPDVLQRDLRIVFCGMAASKKSAQVGAYYAGPGNKFWRILYQIGLTPRLYTPAEFREVADFGIGFTDMVKTQAGNDDEIDLRNVDSSRVHNLVVRFQPRVFALSSKRAAEVFFGRNTLDFGCQKTRIGHTAIWILPSTSGNNNGHWARLSHHWYDLVEFVNRGETDPT